MRAGRDGVGVVLWAAFAGGAALAGAGYGDERDLRSMVFAGVILFCGTAIALLSRWVSQGYVPGSATPITDAPSALALAERNAREIRTLKTRVSGLFLLMSELTAENDLAGPAEHPGPVMRNGVILQFPAGRAGKSGDSQAG